MSENTLFSLDDTGVKEIQATYTPEANKTIIGKLRVAAFPNYKFVEITWENYSNLTEEEKNSETIYFITDKEIIGFKGILYADDYNKIDNTPIYLDENNEVVINENYQAFFDLLINKDIEGNTNEIIVSDGEGWAKGQDIIINKTENEDGEIEYRIGTDNYKSDYIKKENSKITFTDDTFCKTWYKDDIKQNIYNFLTLEDSAKVHFSDNAQLLMHGGAKLHIDDGPVLNNDIEYYFVYSLTLDNEEELTYNDIINNENTIWSSYDSDGYYSLIAEAEMINLSFIYLKDSEIIKTETDGKFTYQFVRTYIQYNGNLDFGSPQVYIHNGCQFHMDSGISYTSLNNPSIRTCIARYTLSFDEEQSNVPPISDFYKAEPQFYSKRDSSSVIDITPEEIYNEGFILKRKYPPCYRNNDKKIWYLEEFYAKIDRNFEGENALYKTSNPQFHMHDKTYFSMAGGSSLVLNNTATSILNGNSYFKMDNDAKAYFNDGFFAMNAKHSSYSTDPLQPCLSIQGGSQLIMNGGMPDSSDINNTLDPALIIDPTGFLYVGQGSEGWKGTGSNVIFGYPSPNDLVPANKNPRIKISDETVILIDGGRSGSGSNFIKIGGDNGGQVQVFLTNNIFQQMSGNAHSEMHDDSKLIMRGNYEQAPWYDYVKDSVDNIIEESRRPVQQGDNGPIVGLYDNPVVMIRGTWEDVEYITSIISEDRNSILYIDNTTVYNTLLNEFNNLTTEVKTLSDFTETSQSYLKTIFINKYPSKSLTLENILDCEITDFTTTIYGNGFYFKNLEYISEYKPEDWIPHLEEKENNPYIEIIESSKVKLSGHAKVELTENFSISTDENGFNFSDGTSSVSFTLAELQNLKALLSN